MAWRPRSRRCRPANATPSSPSTPPAPMRRSGRRRAPTCRRTSPRRWPRPATRRFPPGATTPPASRRCSRRARRQRRPSARRRRRRPTCATRPTSRRASSIRCRSIPSISPASPSARRPERCSRRSTSGPLPQVLLGLEPSDPDYRPMVAEKARLEAMAQSESWGPEVADGETLHPGDDDPRVAELRGRLARLGYLPASGETLDTLFDDGLKAAVERFQRRLRPRPRRRRRQGDAGRGQRARWRRGWRR